MANPLPSADIPDGRSLPRALDAIADALDEWGAGVWGSHVIKHAGKVTREFIRDQAVATPAAIVVCPEGRCERLAGPKAVQSDTRFEIYLIVDGTLEDRTVDGLALADAVCCFVHRCPWRKAGAGLFSKQPQRVEWESLYSDKDEGHAISVWAVGWTQQVDLGTAGETPDPLVPLRRILGDTFADVDATAPAIKQLVE